MSHSDDSNMICCGNGGFSEIERVHPFDSGAFELAIAHLLQASGLASNVSHMKKTARRVTELWRDRLLDGYNVDPSEALGQGFEDDCRDMVIVRNVAIHGICPHHLLPFRGVAHVAYLPDGQLHGFGRITRMIDAISHRFTYQEWMTKAIVTCLMSYGKARGAACIVEADQLCLLMGENRRGDESVVTHSYAGEFEVNALVRSEFQRSIRC